MQEDKTKQYYELLDEFTQYREESIAQKEEMRRQVEKTKQQLEKLTNRVEKKIETRMSEERNLTNHHLQQLEETYKQEIQGLKRGLAQRDKLIGEIRMHLRKAQQQKREIIQGNTKLLVELGQDLDPKAAGQVARDNKYKQLFKMYQFVIEENNDLKKEIYLIKRNNLSSSQYRPDQRSLNTSQSQHQPALNNSIHGKMQKSRKSNEEHHPPKPKKVARAKTKK